MPFDVRIGIISKAGFSIRKFQAVASAMPVALLAPLMTFTGVLPFDPLAEFPVKLVIHSVEGTFGRIGAMVVRPAPDARVECGDEGRLVAPAMGADEFFHLFQVTLLRFAAGLDEDFVAPFAVVFANQELPDGEAEKVKTGATFPAFLPAFDLRLPGARRGKGCLPFTREAGVDGIPLAQYH